MLKLTTRICLVGCLGICAAFAQGNGNGNGNGNGKAIHETLPDNKAGGQAKFNQTISYHGGPVLVNGVNVYYIWYGNWANNTATSILPTLASHIGGSPYFNINTTYYSETNNVKTPVLNLVSLAGQWFEPSSNYYPYGTNLSDANIVSIVNAAISSGKIGAPDPKGVYFVLTDASVNESSGFCTQYCGWHANATIASTDIKYAFIGNAARCPNACSEQTTSPNGNLGADAMASIIAHELEESTTDPDLNAWYDNHGYENADKCAWTFGTTTTIPKGSPNAGALYNMNLGGLNFLIQQNWLNIGSGSCALKY
jgi:hypothetical protein